VTICTEGREEILGCVVGGGVYDAPHTELSDYGKVVEKYLNIMSHSRENVVIDKYVIMPNHIHMIVTIQDDGFPNGTSQAPSPTNHILPLFVSLYKRYCHRECGRKIWQRSYCDHIIRDDQDYREIWSYIDENLTKWQLDEFHPKT
jgi:REP element-mobilizing transposase RayT